MLNTHWKLLAGPARPGSAVGRPSAVKGQSGNPSGRPKQNGDIRQLAREHSADAIAALVASLKDPRIRVADRGYGRPEQAIAAHVTQQIVEGDIDPPPIPETLEEWLARRRTELADLGTDRPLALTQWRGP